MATDFSERLRAARQRAGFKTASDFARAIDVEVATYIHHENGGRRPGYEALGRYAERLGVSVEWLVKGEGAPPAGRPQGPDPAPLSEVTGSRTKSLERPLPAPVHSYPNDLPVLGLEQGAGGTVRLTGRTVATVRRMPGVMTARDAFSIEIPDNAMAPLFRAGRYVVLDPGRLALPGNCAMIELAEPEGALLLREIVSRSDDAITLARYTPAGQETIALSRIRRIVRVVDYDELIWS